MELLAPPPHSNEAEQSLLGALLLDPEAFDRVSFLQPAHFYRADHRLIFEAIRDLVEGGKGADMVTVHDLLGRRNAAEKAGGASYLGALAQNTAGSANIHRYAELVRDKAILRELMRHSSEVIEKAMAGTMEPRELAEEAESVFLSVLAEPTAANEVVHIGKAAAEYVEWMDDHPNGIETGLKDLDALTGGLQPGNLVIIAGRTHMGKTGLALQFAEHICESKPGLMFSLEASRREVAGRMIEWHKHRIGRDQAVDKLFKLQMFIDESAAISPGMMRARLRRMKRQHGLSLVVVDYLQLLRGKGDSREQEVAYLSRELKAIAKEFQVPVLALAQLNRQVEQRADKRPHMSDLRESGAIEQDADLILLLYRPDYYDTQFSGSLAEAEILVAKNRNNGRSGMVKVMFSRDLGRFGDFIPERYRPAVSA